MDREISRLNKFICDARSYVETKYSYNNKQSYVDALSHFSIPNFFCIDVENRKVTYLHFGSLRECPKITSRFQLSCGKNRSISCTVGNIAALMSGKKQEAVALTSKKRRLDNGEYLGTDKTHQTKTNNGSYKKAAKLIAISRRMPDGSFKGNDPKTWTPEKVLNLLKDKNLNYSYIEKVTKSSKEKVKFICDRGHFFKMKINAIQSTGNRCPICNESKGEALSRSIIENITGLKFPKSRPGWLRNPKTKKLMELDGYCEEAKIAFEYDGPVHSEPIFGIRTLRSHMKRDLIKNEICDRNGVKLVRISYKVKNIEEYLKNKIYKIWQK